MPSVPYRHPATDPRSQGAIEEAVKASIKGANHALAGWILGICATVLILPWAVILIGADLAIPKTSVFYSPDPPWIGIGCLVVSLLVAPITILIVRSLNEGIATRVRRVLREGRRFQGRIVQARRVSMTQSKVIVQGDGFMPFEELLSTSLPDAVLFGRGVDVYVHSSDPRPFLIPPT